MEREANNQPSGGGYFTEYYTNSNGDKIKAQCYWYRGEKIVSHIDKWNDKHTYFPFKKGNKWEGAWVWTNDKPPIDWSQVGEKWSNGWGKLKSVDWDMVGQTSVDTGKSVLGILGLEIFGVLTGLGGGPITGMFAKYSWGLMADGLYGLSNGKINLDPLRGLKLP